MRTSHVARHRKLGMIFVSFVVVAAPKKLLGPPTDAPDTRLADIAATRQQMAELLTPIDWTTPSHRGKPAPVSAADAERRERERSSWVKRRQDAVAASGTHVKLDALAGSIPDGQRRDALKRWSMQQEPPEFPDARNRSYFMEPDWKMTGTLTYCGSITEDLAEPPPTDPGTARELAQRLVWYGETGDLTSRFGSFYKTWKPTGPAGPPMLRDLVQCCKFGSGYRDHSGLYEFILRNRGRIAHSGKCVRDPPLVKYARGGYLSMVKALIEAGAAIDECMTWEEVDQRAYGDKEWYWDGDTALVAAAKKGHVSVVLYLLEKGANRKHHSHYDENKSDKTPAAAARRCGNVNDVASLIEQWPNHRFNPPSLYKLAAAAVPLTSQVPDSMVLPVNRARASLGVEKLAMSAPEPLVTPAASSLSHKRNLASSSSSSVCDACGKGQAAQACAHSRCGACCTGDGCSRHGKKRKTNVTKR